MILTVTLNPSVDRSYRVDNFQIGKIFRADEENFVAGGKGINVTKVIRALGEEVKATGFLGGKSGEFIEEELKKNGVDTEFIRIKGETRTCIAILDPVAGTQTEILEKGPEVSSKEFEEFLKHFKDISKGCEIVVASGSLPAGLPVNTYEMLIKIAKENEAKFILDTSGIYLKKALNAKPFMIKPNKEELEKLIEKSLNDVNEIEKAAMSLHDRGIPYVVVSLGSEGAVISCEEGEFMAIPPKIKAASPVGSGDAFTAGMAIAIKNGLNIKEALVLASACGAANALYYRTGYVTKEDVKLLKKKVIVKRI